MKLPGCFTVLCVIAGCMIFTTGSQGKDKDQDSSHNGAQVEKLTLVRDTGENFQPVETFRPTDTFGVVVNLSDARAGTKVKAVWTLVKAGEMENKMLLENEIAFTEETLKNAKIKDRADFTLSHDNPYPTGDYNIEIYLNGRLADSIDFIIE